MHACSMDYGKLQSVLLLPIIDLYKEKIVVPKVAISGPQWRKNVSIKFEHCTE